MRIDVSYERCGILPHNFEGMFYEKGSRLETVYCS